MVTLKDISREVGLSVTQVSRALGGHTDVNADTREKVQRVAQQLGYRPNAIARGLKTGRSGIIAMIVAGSRDPQSNAHLFEIVMGLSAEISRLGQQFVLNVAQPGQDTAKLHEEMYRSGSIDGFVLIGPVRNDPRIARLSALNAPFVVHGRDPTQPHPSVDIENFEVGRRMADHLLAQGHRRIAFLNGPEAEYFAVLRRAGVIAAFAAHGVTPDPDRLLSVTMVEPRGHAMALAMLQQDQPPTAIIAGNTMLARGVYQAAADLGRSIPGDLSVLGHDDGLELYDVAAFHPPLGGTSAHLTSAWGTVAATLKQVIDGTGGPLQNRVLDLAFYPGQSTSPPAT